MRILVAEDNEDNRDILIRRLSKKGHQVEAVGDGAMAVRHVEEHLPDLVLMDLSMPQLSGMQATRQIRSLEPHASRIPIVALTAHAMSGVREECLEAGFDDFATKPIDFKELFATIQKYETEGTDDRG